MTYGYFTADISTGVTCAHSTRPSPGCASGVLRNGHSFPPADAFVVSAQHNPLLRTDGFRYSLPILRNMENKIQPINQILKLYGHEIEMYTVEQGEKRDKRQ